MRHILAVAHLAVAITVSGQSRNTAIQNTRQAIELECRLAANGDWNQWHAALGPYRQALLKSYEYAAANQLPARSTPGEKMGFIFWQTNRARMAHANSALAITAAGDDLPAYLAADRLLPIAKSLTTWLHAQGIDLVVVPVPTVVQTYPEELVSNPAVLPKDRNVIPHLRRKLLTLLENDIEVLDLYPEFMRLRQTESRPLYIPADKHWTERPQRRTAELIAARIARYPWAKTAMSRPPLFRQAEEKFTEAMEFSDFLPDDIRRLAAIQAKTTYFANVSTSSQPLSVQSPNSPVLVTGDSFVNFSYPLHGGLIGHLAREINQPVSVTQIAGNTVNTFQDMFRDPEILKGKKVVVWIINYDPFVCNWMLPEKFTVPNR